MRKKPQYTGLEILEKPACRKMFKYLQKNGNSYYSQIKRELDLNNGMANYTLRQLEEAELVVVDRPEGGGQNMVRVSGYARALLARRKKEKAEEKGASKSAAIHATLSVDEYIKTGMEMERDE